MCFIFSCRSVIAHTERRFVWFFGCICDPRVILPAPSGENRFHSCLTKWCRLQKKTDAEAAVHLHPALTQDVDVYIGQRRTALLRAGTQLKAGRTLEQLLSQLKPRLQQLLQVASFSRADIAAALSDRVRLSPGNKEGIADSMRAFKSSPGRASLRSS